MLVEKGGFERLGGFEQIRLYGVVIGSLCGGDSGGTGSTIQFSVFSRDEATI